MDDDPRRAAGRGSAVARAGGRAGAETVSGRGRLRTGVRGGPAHLSRRPAHRLRAPVERHHDGPHTVGAVDSRRGRREPPPARCKRLVAALVARRRPAGLPGRDGTKADGSLRALDGHRTDGADRGNEAGSGPRDLVARRIVAGVHDGGGGQARVARRAAGQTRGCGMGRGGSVDRPRALPPGRPRLPRPDPHPHLRRAGDRRHAAPVDVGQLRAPGAAVLDARGRSDPLRGEPARRLGVRDAGA